MFYLILFTILFIGVYLVYYYIFEDMLKKEKYTKISELVLFTNKFNLDKKKMNYHYLLKGVSIINAFIMSLTATIAIFLPFKAGIKLIIAFILIMILMFSMYFAYGKYLQKKWGKENGI